MNMVRFIGLFLLATGALLCYSARTMGLAGNIQTWTQVTVPVLQTVAGLGVFFYRPFARRLVFALCVFYITLGIFVMRGDISSLHFLPITPLVERVPESLLSIGVRNLTMIFYFGFPALFILFFSAKHVAVTFESQLAEVFSWRAPILVMFAGAFVLTYHLLVFSQVSHFVEPRRLILFGYVPTAFQSKIFLWVEYAIPFLVAFGIMSGYSVTWAIGLLGAGCYWYPFYRDGFPQTMIQDFQFLFYGIGWALVALALLVHSGYFFSSSRWWERRVSKVTDQSPIAEALLSTGGNVRSISRLKPVEKKHPNILGYLMVVLFLLIIGAGAAAVSLGLVDVSELKDYFASLKRESKTAPRAPASEKKPGVKNAESLPALKLEGVTKGPGGTYAIINGAVLHVGSEVRGYRVEAVEPNRVLLTKGGQAKWLDSEGHLTKAGNAASADKSGVDSSR